ncbi:lanthionine synthetase LanC family protein [Fluoribacter gormanii]|uniref:Serine/threonine protein kinase n=1 Tax=Fluoribacter gormanii TaxID=464 RepID=A0A377GHQ0_9GAMM|nr:lanthionine synthetase LanC family protein [Fluoribacter gormanii]SIR51741.1 Serine/threonine protein kinase [Fluoribacter gormanii]STO24134.1 Serine/threonine-protein kinase pknD [Fluoribacter gormanii]
MAYIEHVKDHNNSLNNSAKDVDYADYLRSFALEPQLRGPWASVGKTDRIQGWKLHISTIPGEAIQLLNCIIPCLLRHKLISFKIAKDTMTLGYLNEGELGRTQIGKFMTIYPQDDKHSVQLAQELVRLTQGMLGPRIISDMRLGDIVYTRYGGFNPIIKRDRLGLMRLMIYAPDQSLRIDEYQVPFKCPDGVENPFKDWRLKLTQNVDLAESVHIVDGKPTKLFGPGYLILDILRDQPKGGVYKALDLRCQNSVGLKILKQGKQFCMTDHYNRDMRTRLQRQAELHANLSQDLPIPSADAYFEVEGDGYLPLDWIEGKSIETFAVQTLDGSTFGTLSLDKKTLLLNWCQKLTQVVSQLHKKGYVHRDLTASNIWLAENGALYLLDLELCHALDDPFPAFGLGTAGFMSPQQANREAPTIADDLYAIGCLLLLVLTGIDPRRIVHNNDDNLFTSLQEITQGAPLPLLKTIIDCISTDPSRRPSLDVISSMLTQSILDLKPKPATTKTNQKETLLTQEEIQDILVQGTRGLLQSGSIQSETGLWLSISIENGAQHQTKHRYTQQYEHRRSANRGVAGVVYALSRLAQFGFLPQEGKLRAQQAIKWLISNQYTVDSELPGLHFGTAGVGVALTEAISTGVQTSDELLIEVIHNCLNKTVDWPDITHGAAGQGIAAMYCFDRLGIPSFQENVEQCADYLITSQRVDGSWIMPEGVPGMSGEILSGFAHGVSGMAYFLAEFSRRKNDNAAWTSTIRAINWLQQQAIHQKIDGDSILIWTYSIKNPARWRWWCHGGPGIALTFLRLYELTGETEYADLVRKTLKIHPANLRYPNLSQCHGLSGLGDIYLEAFRVLGDEEWLERAVSIAKFLFAMRQKTETGAYYWLTEDPHIATADLMVGSCGILHFFLRLLHQGKQIGVPLLLNPANK